MSKQLYSSRYVLKINSSRLRLNNWDLKLTLQEARNSEEVISLGDSQLLRFIRKLTDMNYTENEISDIKKEIKKLKMNKNNKENRKKIIELYDTLDKMLYIPDYVGIIFDNKADFDRATGKLGFKINDIKFKRLLGTTGGIKQNTIMFCNEDIHKELNDMLDNGRNKEIPLIPAKFEAYKSLCASVSTPVTQPRGILVIKDGVTHIKDKVIKVSNDGNGGFKVDHDVDYEADKEFCDGCGMIRKELSIQWAIDLGLTKEINEEIVADYIPSGFNTRYSFEKGMLATFEFEEFGKEVAKTYLVEDAWGNKIDVRTVDIVLTTNMVKLWNCYKDVDDYISNCNKNGYQFSVAKVCPKDLERKRNMNYQYLQSYEDMTDEDIEELIGETISEINGALGEDYRKAILFAKGIHINNKNIKDSDYDYIRALMVDKRVIDDSYVKSKIYIMIEKRIRDAKKGVLTVNGNYSIILGDLYALCESMFGMEVKGLLGKGEFYSRHWSDLGEDEIVAFRSPMTSHNNIKKMKLTDNEELKKWFKYIDTCIIFNAWDTTTDSINGADFDSDAIISSNSNILKKRTQDKQAIVCEQKSVPKVKVTESLIKKSNKNGFGEDIGTITNRVTAMFDVLASLDKNSEEYNELMDRIICGQAYQQESIDRIKGIEAKKMPKEWYDYKTNKIKLDDTESIVQKKQKDLKLMVNKKPYFFIYNYEHLMRKYKTFVKDVNNNCIIRFGCTIDELDDKENKTEEEIRFINSIKYKNPVFKNNCVMNRICWRIEKEYKNIKLKVCDNGDFDYEVYKSDYIYNKNTYNKVELLFKEYRRQQKQYSQTIHNDLKEEDKISKRNTFIDNFRMEANKICSNEKELCNIVVDMVYKTNSNKQFAWDVCGEQMIRNLLEKNNNKYKYPIKDENGDIEWQGYKFSMKEVTICEE